MACLGPSVLAWVAARLAWRRRRVRGHCAWYALLHAYGITWHRHTRYTITRVLGSTRVVHTCTGIAAIAG